MFTRITQLLQKRRKIKVLFLIICFSLLSLYPIFRNFYYGNGILTYERHIAFLEKRSDFYNPWQYRVLSPMITEGLMWTYNHTIDKIYPIEEHVHFQIESTTGTMDNTSQLAKILQTPGALKYFIVFIMFRFIEHMVVFLLAYIVWSYFVKNDWLIFFGLIFVTLSMGNSVAVADLTFNTYIDNILYLLTACVIIFNLNPLWLLLIIFFGALNRETSILIPFFYFISKMSLQDFSLKKFNLKDIRLPVRNVWLITIAQYVIFFAIFFAIRNYYGYRQPQMWKVPAGLPMLKLNLLSGIGLKSYFEMLGTFAVIPLIILYKFRSFPYLLKTWFIGIVPVWFLAHLITVVTYQTRLFLVPTILIFLPMMLMLIEQNGRKIYSEEKISL